ncbi:hypothetical protein [uncultured Eubacterium sp.]|uniref:hypothetical protein n=1 Tax=uncultured Eubacterium sp. TaxID=165185 RepID=UPI0025E60029|nr:hypothetical protein [uncultured Eubacterium sp.]MCI6536692.1 hypothetical protein [Lachnospiraceae bacterium]
MNTEPEKKQKVLTEVWGDTVNIKELAISIILGVIFTMVFYLIGRKIFMSMGTIEENLAKGYALFVGIAGCFIAAVISAKAFRPKRIVGELDSTTDVAEVLEYAHMTPEEEGEALTKVGPDVIKEMEDLELYGLLALIPEGANNYKPEYRELAGGQSKKDA